MCTYKFETSFHEYGLMYEVKFFAIMHGPSSPNRPISLSEPGPPLSHKVMGSVAGERLLSKNQKKLFMPGATLM